MAADPWELGGGHRSTKGASRNCSKGGLIQAFDHSIRKLKLILSTNRTVLGHSHDTLTMWA